MTAAILSDLIVGESDSIRQLRDLIVKLAPAALPILIEGPTGSGKELVAEALHRLSGRSGAYVPFNVCAIPEGMVEDALFGHVRGAYTGAASSRTGYLAEANNGTAFFDEIGGLPLFVQAKLLRALETRHFRRVGDDRDMFSDFRAVAASNESVEERVMTGSFRADLFYRLSGFRLSVPALLDRLSDIPLLVRNLLERRLAFEGTVTSCAIRTLQAHTWPGNVRELLRVLEASLILSTGGRITRREIVPSIQRPSTKSGSLDQFERKRLIELLEQAGDDVAILADQTGVHPATVYRWLNKFGIKIPRRFGRRRPLSGPDVPISLWSSDDDEAGHARQHP